MHLAGLTPPLPHVQAARAAWGEDSGLLVMVRPRGGGFEYTSTEARAMATQIEAVAEAGADGVVFGALQVPDGRVCEATMYPLLRAAIRCGVTTTFHRAFDVSPDPAEALETLIGLGVTRVLTSGCPWGSDGTAWEGVTVLQQTICQAAGRIEVVVCGGVTAAGVFGLRAALPLCAGPVSFHAYRGAQKDGLTDTEAVRALVEATRDSRAEEIWDPA